MQEHDHITRTNLKKDRGWTDWMIREFLNQPDKEYINNFGKTVNLYSLRRIEQIEKSSEYKARLPEIWRLKIKAEKAIKTREDKTVEWAEQVPIVLTKLEPLDLYKRALRWHEVKDFSTISEDLAKRWMVNYLRHHCTEYDGLTTAGLYNKIGRNRAYQVIRERTLILIGKEYPILAMAARDQLVRYKHRQ